jgi:isopentenyl phosphate kinase
VAEVVIHCIPQPGTDATEVAAELGTYLQAEFATYLQEADGVSPVQVEVEQPRVGLAEVLAIIQLTSATIDLTGKLVDFIKSRRDKGKVKEIEIEIDGERVPIGNLTPDQRTRIAAAIA